MWDDVARHLSDFESAVLTALDAEGYPYSVRCRPRTDPAGRVLQIRLTVDAPLRAGPASLLCHRHDENLWNLKSFLVRGTKSRRPGLELPSAAVYPGGRDRGLMGMVRFVTGSRRSAKRYLEKRNLPRPRIPWEEINAIKAQARAGEDESTRA